MGKNSHTATAQKAEHQKRLRINEEKWSKTLMDAGWTALPSILLDKQHALGIDAIDLNILMQSRSIGGNVTIFPIPRKRHWRRSLASI